MAAEGLCGGVKRQRAGVPAPHWALHIARCTSRDEKGKGQSDFSDWPLLMPATTYAPTHLARAVPSALRGLTSVFGMGTGGSPAVRSPTSRSCQLSAVGSQPVAGADVLC